MSLLISTDGRILTSLRFYSRMDKADTGGHCREGEVRGDQLVTPLDAIKSYKLDL